MFNLFQIIEAKSEKEIQLCVDIRKEVFINEQGVNPIIEIDNIDYKCEHILAFYKNQPVATARLQKISEEKYKVGRMAVKKKHRRYGIGSEILLFIENYLKKKQIKKIELNAQKYVEKFYLKNGFNPVGDEFFEADILHIKMQKNIISPL
ncbi:MAG: GNAT family N-acetyltransferase [Dehalococcoidia bacterium]|nr:GNAT family N-acetyltransferase [Dehalococcoidia bacterium]MQG09564.1 GNAT family N-acetyltransferase [SAR202 cluster bacterium]|tara:strand:- start:1017 stop:1466 length:450 start_codon:yes stop_codon:yes gene_type:complete